MPSINTKDRILKAAMDLFNENGIANIRLQQIADEIGISPGNLAYHFKNKEAITEAVHEELFEQVSEILATYRLFPNLMDFDNQLTKYFAFAQKYPFYFMDVLEIDRNYPAIHARRQIHISKMIRQIRKRFDFNVRRGLIEEESRVGVYDDIAKSIWVLITFWVPQNILTKSDQVGDKMAFKRMVWNQVYPYLTADGLAEYRQLIVPMLKQASPEE